MSPEGERRLRDHVTSIVERASPPEPIRSDLAEELLGHLVECVEADVASGTDEEVAIGRAVAEFGDPASIGQELGRTYHSRLWASTIGVLVPSRPAPGQRPGIMAALGIVLALESLLLVGAGVAAVALLTPVRAGIVVAVIAASIGANALAFRGLGAGQRWAVRFSIASVLLILVSGVAQAMSAPSGTTVIPLGSILAAGLLIWARNSWATIGDVVSGSRPIGTRLGGALGLALVAPMLASPGLDRFQDPSQTTAADVTMTVSMTCGRHDVQVPDGPLLHDRQFGLLVADLAWSRADLLPHGLAGLVDHDSSGDTASFRIVESSSPTDGIVRGLPSWLLEDNAPTPVVLETGEVAGWFGSTSPSVNLIPDTIGSFTVGIDQDRIAAHRTIRIAWTISPMNDAGEPWPRAEVAYAHLDRFLIEATVGCGEIATGRPVPIHPEAQRLSTFPDQLMPVP